MAIEKYALISAIERYVLRLLSRSSVKVAQLVPIVDESEDRESCIGQRNGEGKIRDLPRSRFSSLPDALFYHLDCIMSCFNGLVKFLIYALGGHEKFPLVIIGQLNHS